MVPLSIIFYIHLIEEGRVNSKIINFDFKKIPKSTI